MDARGVTIPATTIEKAQFALGPGIRYEQALSDSLTLSVHGRGEVVGSLEHSTLNPWASSLHGRITGGVDLGFSGGAALSFTVSHDGLFRQGQRTTSVNLRLNAPIN